VVDDLFGLSRLEAGEVQWSMEQVRLDQLVLGDGRGDASHADASRVAMHAGLDHRLAPALGNPDRLQRVLFNPIQNAIRHTPADGSAVVRAEAAPGRAIEVEVADSGNGIDPELRDRVFEPFTQGPSRVAERTGRRGWGWLSHARLSMPTAPSSGCRTPVRARASGLA
jgi:signal transduction histidine kinase